MFRPVLTAWGQFPITPLCVRLAAVRKMTAFSPIFADPCPASASIARARVFRRLVPLQTGISNASRNPWLLQQAEDGRISTGCIQHHRRYRTRLQARRYRSPLRLFQAVAATPALCVAVELSSVAPMNGHPEPDSIHQDCWASGFGRQQARGLPTRLLSHFCQI